MMEQFIKDLNKVDQSYNPYVPISAPNMFNGYLFYGPHHNNGNNQLPSGTEAVLDLSTRRDSVETRTTPSPYNTTSSCGQISPTGTNGSFIQTPSQLPGPIAPVLPIYYPMRNQHRSPSPNSEKNKNSKYLYHNEVHSTPTRLPIKKEIITTDVENNNNNNNHADYNDAAAGSNSSSDSSVSQKGNISTERAVLSEAYSHILSPNGGKPTRPFKVYPRDPLTIAASFSAADAILDPLSAEKYQTFRKRILDDICVSNGGQQTVSNPKMRRTKEKRYNEKTPSESASLGNESSGNEEIGVKGNNLSMSSILNNCSNDGQNQSGTKDSAYYERRRKNNVAAKKSRDRRRIKEDELAIRASYLERENLELRFELAAVKKQLKYEIEKSLKSNTKV